MLPQTSNPCLTTEVADPLETLRFRISLWLLPLGALAALAAWGLSVAADKLSPPDKYLLLPIASGFLALEVYLGRNPQSIRWVWQVALSLIAVYEVVSLYYEAAYKLHERDGITPAALWFPMVFLLAFNLLNRRQALLFSLVYLAVGLLSGGLGLLSNPSLNATSINTILQFTLSNIAYLVLLHMFSLLRHHYAQMHQMAYTDALTSMINRRGMQQRLESELERARRYNRPFALILADIDHFKKVNDTYGHSVGDQVLREVAGRLAQNLRDSDSLARWGGEEFLILAPETNLHQAHLLAQRLREAISERPISGLVITLSLGVACYRQGDSVAGLLSRADEAMYQAKANGRNQVVLEELLDGEVIPAHHTMNQ